MNKIKRRAVCPANRGVPFVIVTGHAELMEQPELQGMLSWVSSHLPSRRP
jgi:hypothetical protein